MRKLLVTLMLAALMSSSLLLAGTTGKIAGTIRDADTGEPLPGVNVVLQGTTLGAATNLQGYYVILNVPPGNYEVVASIIGYTPARFKDVRVNIDLTTSLEVRLKSTVLELGEEITVVAERPVVRTDVSASTANVEASTIAALPVQSVSATVGLQAGVRGLQVRGGGIDQTAFMVDGVVLRDERTNQPIFNVSLSTVEEIQVQSGGFNAEYGDARSGIVNVVTREPDHWSGILDVRYSPEAQKHFGPSIYDPNNYWNRPYLDDAVAWTGTRNGAWDAFTQKQYRQFDGWNFISQQTLSDNDPTNDLTPEAAQRLYKFQHRRKGDIDAPDVIIDGGLGGAVPLIGQKLGNLRFFASYRREKNMYLIPLSRDDLKDYTGNLKLISNLTKTMKLTLSGLYSEIHGTNNNGNGEAGYFSGVEDLALLIGGGPFLFRSFRDAIMYAPEAFAPTDIYTRVFSAKLTHVLNAKSFYEVTLSQTGRNYFTGPNPLRNRDKIFQFGNTYYVDEAPFGFESLPSTGIDGLRMGVGFSNSRDRSRWRATDVKFDLTSQFDANNQIKAGFDILYGDQSMNYRSVDIVLPASRPATQWRKFPIRAGVYLQDKLEFKGLVANLGLRMDYQHAQGDWYDVDLFDRLFFSNKWTPAYEGEVARAATERKIYWSPRLGIAHPISVNSKLYFNYGHFRQRITPDRLYQVRRITGNQLSRLGSPSNDLARTIAYELGYEHNLFNQFLLKLAGYYKDVTDQPLYVRYISVDNLVDYERALNTSYEDLRGFEISLSRSFGRWFNGFANYTYEVGTFGFFGTNRIYEDPSAQRDYDSENRPQDRPRPRPYARANFVITTPNDFGPRVAGFKVLGDWQTSVIANWRSGRWITYNPSARLDILSNIQWDDFKNVDLRLSRELRLNQVRLKVFVDVNNVFNLKTFSFYGFSTSQDYDEYLQSLRLPREAVENLGYVTAGQDYRYGNDKIGDLRPQGVAYEPYNPNDPTKTPDDLKRILDTKAYIDNPNLEALWFLDPRDVFWGVKMSFDF